MEWYAFIAVVSGLLGIIFKYRKTLGNLEQSYEDHFFGNSRPMCIFEPATLRIAEVNNAAVSCYGYSREEFLHMTLLHIIPPGEIERLQPSLQGSSQETTDQNIGLHKKKNGDGLYVNVISRPHRWKGKPMRVAIINNVTELIHSKEALQAVNNRLEETLQRYDTLVEATHEAVWEYDIEKGTLLWNRGIETIFGYREVPKEAGAWFARIPGEDLEKVRASMSVVLQNRLTTWSLAYRFYCADGDCKHIENKAAVIYNAEGNPVKMIGSMRDVEERYQLEKEVLKLSMIAQVSSNAILVMDKHGRIEWANESFISLSGFTLEEAKGKYPQELLHGEETSDVTAQEIREYTQAKQRFSREIINYRKDRSKYWVNVHFSPLMANGELQNTIAIQNDITELKEREKKITEQNLRLKEVAFANSHIIRAPVANIIGLANLLAMSTTLHEEDKEVVSHLQQSTDKLDILIRNISRRSEMI